MLGKLAGSFMKVCVPLATMSSASTIDSAIQRKMRARGVARAEKRNHLIISNEDMNNIFKVIKTLENLGLLIGGTSKIVKHEIKKQEDGFLGMLLGTLDASIVENILTGKGKTRAGKRYSNMDKNV